MPEKNSREAEAWKGPVNPVSTVQLSGKSDPNDKHLTGSADYEYDFMKMINC